MLTVTVMVDTFLLLTKMVDRFSLRVGVTSLVYTAALLFHITHLVDFCFLFIQKVDFLILLSWVTFSVSAVGRRTDSTQLDEAAIPHNWSRYTLHTD